VVSLALIALVLRKLDWAALGAVLVRLDARWAAAGWALTFLLICGLALRWRIFLQQQQIAIRFRTVFFLTWAGQFFNSILPGSTGGDVVKIYQLCRIAPQRKAAAAASVFADRFSALLALVIFAGIAFLLEPMPLRLLVGAGASVNAAAVWLLLIALVGVAGGWLLLRKLNAVVWLDRIGRVITETRKSVNFQALTLLAFAMAFAIHLVNFTMVYCFARALGLGLTFGEVLLMFPVVLFLVLLPITINGHGLRELLLIGYFTFWAVTLPGAAAGVREIAVALSLLLVANDLLWSLPGGVAYLLKFSAGQQPANTGEVHRVGIEPTTQ
jgi:glycosyltransferase 2 family protein